MTLRDTDEAMTRPRRAHTAARRSPKLGCHARGARNSRSLPSKP
jgi:hypothetical protein